MHHTTLTTVVTIQNTKGIISIDIRIRQVINSSVDKTAVKISPPAIHDGFALLFLSPRTFSEVNACNEIIPQCTVGPQLICWKRGPVEHMKIGFAFFVHVNNNIFNSDPPCIIIFINKVAPRSMYHFVKPLLSIFSKMYSQRRGNLKNRYFFHEVFILLFL